MQRSLKLLRTDGAALRRDAPEGELEDEHLARLGEEHRSLGRDHTNVLVALHDALDASQRKVVVVLEVLLGADLKDVHLRQRR